MKTYYDKLSYLYFFCIAIFLQGCCAECFNDEKDIYIIPEDYKSWVVFQEGTWWVYVNEQDSTIDSAWVNSVYNYYSVYTYYEEVEAIEVVISSSFLYDFITHAYQTTTPGAKTSVGAIHTKSWALASSIIQNQSSGNDPKIEFIKFFPVLNINNNDFYNVYCTKSILEIASDTIVSEYYFVKNIGLIRFKSKTNQANEVSWGLKKWNIVQ